MERSVVFPGLIVVIVIAVAAVIAGQQQENEAQKQRLVEAKAKLAREHERLRQAEARRQELNQERRRTEGRHRVESRRLERRAEAEQVRRSWSDTFALCSAGVIVVALVLIGSLLRVRAGLLQLVRRLARSWRGGGTY